MVRYLLLLLFLASCSHRTYECVEVGNQLNCVNLVDREGLTEMVRTPERLKQYETVDFLKPQPYQKVMRVYKRDGSGNIAAIVTQYHANGYPKQYLEILNGQASGCYKEWYPNGVLKVESTIIGGSADLNTAAEKSWLFDGISSAWDENGALIATIEYSKGELSGVSTYYHANGAIWKKIPYAANRVHGDLCIYLENGDLLQKTAYASGNKDGPAIRYWKPEVVAAEEFYEKGKLRDAAYYDLNGNLVAKIEGGNGFRATFGKDSISELQEFKDGQLDGEVKVFTPTGQIARIYRMRNDDKHGEETLFYPKLLNGEPIPKMSLVWYQGKIQGQVKTWYDNGIMESQRTISDNERNGLATAWYRDGNLMMLEEYDQGLLVRGDYYRKKEKQPVSQVSDGKGTATLFDSEGNFIRKINYNHGKPEA